MNTIHKYTFINDTFSQEDAREVLMKIHLHNINYYKLKNLSSQIRFEKNDANAQKIIPALQSNLQKIEETIAEAKAKNKRLIINSEIRIELTDI